jgi:hypothetical protein
VTLKVAGSRPVYHPKKMYNKYMNDNKNKKRTMFMEDVRDISVEVSDLIEKRLENFDIKLTDKQADAIHNKVWEVLEDVSNGDYRHHH